MRRVKIEEQYIALRIIYIIKIILLKSMKE